MTKLKKCWTNLMIEGKFHTFYYPEYVKELEAREQELLAENEKLKIQLQLAMPMVTKLKADAIEEFVCHLKEKDDGDIYFLWFCADKYIAKLREGEDYE